MSTFRQMKEFHLPVVDVDNDNVQQSKVGTMNVGQHHCRYGHRHHHHQQTKQHDRNVDVVWYLAMTVMALLGLYAYCWTTITLSYVRSIEETIINNNNGGGSSSNSAIILPIQLHTDTVQRYSSFGPNDVLTTEHVGTCLKVHFDHALRDYVTSSTTTSIKVIATLPSFHSSSSSSSASAAAATEQENDNDDDNHHSYTSRRVLFTTNMNTILLTIDPRLDEDSQTDIYKGVFFGDKNHNNDNHVPFWIRCPAQGANDDDERYGNDDDDSTCHFYVTLRHAKDFANFIQHGIGTVPSMTSLVRWAPLPMHAKTTKEQQVSPTEERKEQQQQQAHVPAAAAAPPQNGKNRHHRHHHGPSSANTDYHGHHHHYKFQQSVPKYKINE